MSIPVDQIKKLVKSLRKGFLNVKESKACDDLDEIITQSQSNCIPVNELLYNLLDIFNQPLLPEDSYLKTELLDPLIKHTRDTNKNYDSLLAIQKELATAVNKKNITLQRALELFKEPTTAVDLLRKDIADLTKAKQESIKPASLSSSAISHLSQKDDYFDDLVREDFSDDDNLRCNIRRNEPQDSELFKSTIEMLNTLNTVEVSAWTKARIRNFYDDVILQLKKLLVYFIDNNHKISSADLELLVNNLTYVDGIYNVYMMLKDNPQVKVENNSIIYSPVTISILIGYSRIKGSNFNNPAILNMILEYPIKKLSQVSDRYFISLDMAIGAYVNYLTQTGRDLKSLDMEFLLKNLDSLDFIKDNLDLLAVVKINVDDIRNFFKLPHVSNLLFFLRNQQHLQEYTNTKDIAQILSLSSEDLKKLTCVFKEMADNSYCADHKVSINSLLMVATKTELKFKHKNTIILCQALDTLTQYALNTQQKLTPELVSTLIKSNSAIYCCVFKITEVFNNNNITVKIDELVTKPSEAFNNYNNYIKTWVDSSLRVDSSIDAAKKRSSDFKKGRAYKFFSWNMDIKARLIDRAIENFINAQKDFSEPLKTIEEVLNWKAEPNQLSIKEALAWRRFFFASKSAEEVKLHATVEYAERECKVEYPTIKLHGG